MNISEYYTVLRSSGKVIGQLSGYSNLSSAIEMMISLSKEIPDVVVIAGETCEIICIPRTIGNSFTRS